MKYCLSLISLLFVASCSFVVPTLLQQEFNLCYNGKNTGIDSLINTRGVYEMTDIWERDTRNTIKGQWIHKIDTIRTYLLIYPDGTFLYYLHDKNIPQYFKDVVKNTNKGKKDSFYKYYFWGCYIICEDTIKAQVIQKPFSFNDNWIGSEVWFKVIDRNTLKKVAVRRLFPDPDHEINFIYGEDRQETAKFIPLDTIPNSDCWLKKQNWFWCDQKAK